MAVDKHLIPSLMDIRNMRNGVVAFIKEVLPKLRKEEQASASKKEPPVNKPKKMAANAKSSKKPHKKAKKASHKKKAKAHAQPEPGDTFVEASPIPPTAVNPFSGNDPAHSPGHRKLDVEGQFNESSGDKVQIQHSALNRMSRSDRIDRVTAQKRINGFVNSAGSRRAKGSKRAH